MITAPQTFMKPGNFDQILKRLVIEREKMPSDITLIVHGSYWYNFVAGGRKTGATIAEIRNHFLMCKELGVKYYVTHNGAFWTEADRRKSIPIPDRKEQLIYWKHITLNLLSKIERCGVTLCYETTAGTKAGNYAGSVDELLWLRQEVNHPQVGYCFDTCHSYTNGEKCFTDLSDLEQIIKLASVIHFNGNYEGNEFGAHKDRHSSSILSKSWGLNPEILSKILLWSKAPLVLEK